MTTQADGDGGDGQADGGGSDGDGPADNAADGGPRWSLTLYVSGASPRSAEAIDTARRICDDELAGRVDLTVIDVTDHPALAVSDDIFAVPTMVKRLPSPLRQLVGDLADVDRVRAGLDLGPLPPPQSRDPNSGGAGAAATARRTVMATPSASLAELTRLRAQVEDLRAAVTAIRTGGIDAIMVGEATDEQLYTLTNADRAYRVIVEEMGEAAATVSERGVLLYANARLADLTGRDRFELVGADVSALVDPPDRPLLGDLLTGAAGETRRGELHLAGRGGTAVLASAAGLDIDGVLVRCLIATDLTQRRRNEHLLAEANAVIAAHVDLERANTELTRSNEDLAQFAYVASHDLSKPPRGISGFADLLQVRYHGQLDDDADTFIDFITAGTARMQQLINDLLDYSRVSSHAQPITSIDSQHVLRDVLADLNGQLVDTGASVYLDSEFPVVDADGTQLGQVFASLIRNAVTFVAAGTTPEVHVTAGKDGSGWRFTVADNGIGVPVQHRTRVFGMFKRLHSRDAYPGIGVGLSIAHRVVERHGGTIWIEDNPGAGSRFIFTIPDVHPTTGAGPGAPTPTRLA